MIVRKARSMFRRIKTAVMRKLTSISAAQQLWGLAESVDNPFFVIVMPGSLHILKVFMQYAPKTVDFILILNGVNEWETNWLQTQYHDFRRVTMTATLQHGAVMDLIIDHYKKPFGLIDSDCFVFDPLYYKKAQSLDKNTILNAFFYLSNNELDLEIPQTYFLFFNPITISRIKNKYRVNSEQYQYQRLPRLIKERLLSIGIDASHLPESFKKLFDTLRLVVVLGLADGYEVNFIEKFSNFSQPNSEMYHIGAVYHNNNIKRLSSMRGSYFWRICLEKCEDTELIRYYYAKYGNQTSLEILNSNLEFASLSSTKTYVEFVDKLLSKNIDIVQTHVG